MPDPKQKLLKIPLPAELYDKLEAAAVADDRDLERFVVRMVKQYLAAPGDTARFVPGFVPSTMQEAPGTTHVIPAPVGLSIPLVTKAGAADGVPFDLMNDNALNGAGEVENPNLTHRPPPRPNPNALNLFGSSHKK